jgi:hypothetical protein
MAWAWHYSQAVNERADGWECVCERVKAPSQAAQTRAESCFRFVCLSVCLSWSLQVQRRLFTSFFFNFYFFVCLPLSLTPSGRRLGRGRTQRRRSVAGRSANQRTTGTGTKETKDARQDRKEAERGRCGGSRRAAHPFIVCASPSPSPSARPSATEPLCVVARGAIGCAGSTLFCPTLAHAHAAVPRLAWVAFVGGRYLPTLRYATLRTSPGEAAGAGAG